MGLSRDDSDTLWQAVQDRKFCPPLLSLHPQTLLSAFFSRYQIENMMLTGELWMSR